MFLKRSKSSVSKLLSLLLISSGLVAVSAPPASAVYVPNATRETVITFDSAVAGDFTNLDNHYAVLQTSSSPTVSSVASVSAGAPATGQFLVVNKYWEPYGLTWLPALSGDEYISSLGKTVKLRIFTPRAGIPINLKLDNNRGYPSATGIEKTVTSNGGWEVVTFDFNGVSPYTESVSYTEAALFFNIGVGEANLASNSNGGPFYFDDLTYTSPAKTVITFDSAVAGDFSNFDNHYAVLVTSSSVASVSAGAPTSGKFLEVNKYWEPYGGSWLPALSGDEYISSLDKKVKLRIFTPRSGMPITLKIDNNRGYPSATAMEKQVISSGGWEVVTFDFNGVTPYTESVSYTEAALFFNIGVGEANLSSNSNGGPFFFDDLTYTSTAGSAPQVVVPLTISQPVQYDFETMPAGFQATDGGTVGNESTPAGSGAPTGTKSAYMTESSAIYSAAKLVRTGSEFISANGKVVQMRVKVPSTTTSVTLKLQDPDYDPAVYHDLNLFVEKTVTPGTTSWTVVEFNFASGNTGNYAEGNDYTIGVLFFNVGVSDPANVKFYFDDVAFTSSVITQAQAGSSTTPRSGENKGNYPHIRLEKSFLDTNLDATWWDGVWQYRDEDTRAYLKYIPVRSTFKLTYTVTDKDDQPMANALVTLIVNANYSCAKTFFMYENSIIGPDDCAGNGETQLPAKRTDADGKVTFVLTNTNAEGEKMPASLNGAPNGKELGTNIKPHLVGATREGIDMLFAHFVEQTDAAKVLTTATETVKTGVPHTANFQFLDEAGKPMANQLAEYYINGPDSKQDWVLTDAQGRVQIPVPNSTNAEGTSAVAVSVKRTGRLPLTATSMVTWVPGAIKVTMAPSSNSVEVKIANATNKSVKIVVNGKSYERTPTAGLVTYKFPATVGKKVIRVTIGKKLYVKGVTVRK